MENIITSQEYPQDEKQNNVPQTPREVYILDDVLNAVRAIGLFNPYVMEVVLATYISKELGRKNPLWLMIVSDPSSNKTELVSLLKNAAGIFMLDSMTANPFISGIADKEQPQDLLPKLNGKCFIVKDYTSLFSQHEETVKKVIGDLVNIYDGSFSRHSGIRGTISYEATFSHVGCITPLALNSRQTYMNMVGPRFLTLRLPDLSDDELEQSFGIVWDETTPKHRDKAAEITTTFVENICEGIRTHGVNISPPNESMRKRLNLIAQLTARARGEVHLKSRSFIDDEGKEVKYQEIEEVQHEKPFRALHQFKTLCTALAIIRGKEEITEAEIDTIRLVALSSMPVHRSDVLSVFESHDHLTAKEASELLEKSYATAKRNLDELVALKILYVEKIGDTHVYFVATIFKDLISPSTLPF